LAITREKKAQILENYREILKRANGMIITEYRGMSVKNISASRKVARDAKGSYNVTKITLFKIALQENGFAVPEDLLKGPTAVAISYGDLSGLTKVVLQRAKEDELLVLKGAIMGQEVFRGKEQLEALSTMPTLDEARASLIGTLQQPAARIIGLMAQPGQQLAMLLKAFTDKESGGEAA
jgi:large subunit ribosomal protein L10